MFFRNKNAFSAQGSNVTNNSANVGILNTPQGNFSFGISTQPTPFMSSGASTLTSNNLSNDVNNVSSNSNITTNTVTPFSPTQPPPPPPPPQYSVPFTNVAPTFTSALSTNQNYLASFPANQQQQQQREEQHKNSEAGQGPNSNLTFSIAPTSSSVQGHSAFAPAASTFAKSAFSLHPTTSAITNSNTNTKFNNSSMVTSNTANNTQPVLAAASVFGANSAFVSAKHTTANLNSSSKLVFGNNNSSNSVLPFSHVKQNVTQINKTNSINMTINDTAMTEIPLAQSLSPGKEEQEEEKQEWYELERQEEEEEEYRSEKESLEKEEEEEQENVKVQEPLQSSNRSTFTNTVFASSNTSNVAPLSKNQESVFKPRRTQFLYSSSFSAQDAPKPNSTLTSNNKTSTNTPFAPPWQHKEVTSQESKGLQEQSAPLLFTTDAPHKGILSSPAFNPQDKLQTQLPEKTSSSSFQIHTTLPINNSELCLLSRVFASFVETMIKLSCSDHNSNTTQLLCASLHRQLELALFGVAGQVGVYASYDKMVNELLAVWERAKQRTALSSSSSSQSKLKSPSPSTGVSFSKVRGELWVLIFALGSQVNFIVHTLQEYLESEYQVSDNTENKNSSNSCNNNNKHITEELYTLKQGIIASAEDALNDACEYANQLGQFALELYQRDGEENINSTTSSSSNSSTSDNMETGYYIILPVLLQRTRLTFEAASTLGLPNPRSSSNMRSITSKLFSLLNKRIKQSVVTVVPVPESPTWPDLPTPVNNSNNNNNNNNNNNLSPSSPSTLTFAGYNTPNSQHKQWKLTWRSEGQRQLIIAFASVIAEMMMSDAPTNEEVEMFIVAFHEALPGAHAERCKLYECQANQLFMQPLTMSVVRHASILLAHALITLQCTQNDKCNYENNSSKSVNKNSFTETHRSLALKLTTAQLALGKLPHVSLQSLCSNNFYSNSNDNNNHDIMKGEKEERSGKVNLESMFAFPELDDVMMAVRSANMTLYELALRNNAMYYVQNGIHNTLCFVRKRIALLMVVKFYMYKQCDSRLRVPEMIAYHHLHYVTLFEAMTSWLLPLLVEKFINGVLDNDSLVLSEANPFDDYSKAELLQGARNFTSSTNNN